MRRMEARWRKARAFFVRFSQFLAKRRQRLSLAKVRFTTQRSGRTSKPLALSERLTICVMICGKTFRQRPLKLRPLIATIGDSFFRKGNLPNSVSRISRPPSRSSISAVNHGMRQKAYRGDQDMPFLTFDCLTRVIAGWVNADPLFSALFTLWLSIMPAVGAGVRPCQAGPQREPHGRSPHPRYDIWSKMMMGGLDSALRYSRGRR